MTTRIEIISKGTDTRAIVRKTNLEMTKLATKINNVEIVDVYTLDINLDTSQSEKISEMLTNPITQKAFVNKNYTPKNFDWAIEIGYLPGVTDNIAQTTKEGIEDLLNRNLKSEENIYTSQITFIDGKVSDKEIKKIGEQLANPLIQRIHIKDYNEFIKENGMDLVIPKVKVNNHTLKCLCFLLKCT